MFQEPSMTKYELIERLSSEADLPLKKADNLVTLVFSELSDALAKGERVEIRGFGSFKIKHYDSYTGVNPKTLEPVAVKPKKLPFFKCGLELRRRINSQKV
jgi:integration host factor subunit beta